MKERLTGAIILVALLVLLVPELLSGPGPAAATANPPSVDGQQMRSYTIDLGDDTAPPRSASVVAAATPAPSPAVPESSPVAPPAAALTDAQSGNAARASDGAARTVTAVEAPTAAPARPAMAVSPSSAPPARPAASPPSTQGGWAVQVGSFASRENAERLARELKGKGFASHVSESSGNGKRLWRVRVGPEPDRASAVALGARLRATGQSGSVVPMP